MPNLTDIQRMISSLRSGTSGNRNPVDVADTQRIIEETANGQGERLINESGTLLSSNEEQVMRIAREDPNAVFQAIKNLKLSF